MPARKPNILISGAGVAGPILAYWLTHDGFNPTVIERAPALRTGGHPVDLWGSAVEVVERMGVLPELEAASTRNDIGVMLAEGQRPVEIDLKRLVVEIADRHIEIMRGRLVSVLYERTKSDVEYLFGNSITALDEGADGVRVTFERGAAREFALVIGADGQHSNVRRLAFGEEARFSRYIGGYICGYTIPNYLGLDGRIPRYVVPNKTVAAFPIRQSNEIGAGFLFRRDEPLDVHYDDVDGQKRLLREIYATEGWETPRLLAYLDEARDFYFDSFSQIRMESWSRGRITLVGDAGYGPAPAVGGGTSLAAVAAYVLARELAEADGDYLVGLRNYENAIQDAVMRSRDIGPAVLNTLIPRSRLPIWLGQHLAPLVLALPRTLQQWLPLLPRKATRAMRAISAIPLKDYSPLQGAKARVRDLRETS
jgi:2-polyprenyl-6-methoxyphenol hydroxylase-like FAD-dependent oxidoreductase